MNEPRFGAPSLRAITLAAVALALLLATGCASFRPLVTPAAEVHAYRATRVSPTLEGRIVAAARYLATYPDGAFASEVRDFFGTAEPLYFEENRHDAAGLHVYLAALPRGPHADEARQRLRFAASRSSGPTGFDLRAMQTDARVAELAKKRAEARNEITGLLDRFLDPEVFARPLSEAKPELLVPWSLTLPWPRCSLNDEAKEGPSFRCTKLLELPYDVVQGEGSTEERQATVEVVVVEDARGRPTSVTIGGPDLFLRTDETFSGRAASREDTRDKARAMTRVVELVWKQFAARISDDPACRKTTRGPALLVLACHDMRVVVLPGVEPGEDDRIAIGPARSN